jgi:hypothetical protein
VLACVRTRKKTRLVIVCAKYFSGLDGNRATNGDTAAQHRFLFLFTKSKEKVAGWAFVLRILLLVVVVEVPAGT